MSYGTNWIIHYWVFFKKINFLSTCLWHKLTILIICENRLAKPNSSKNECGIWHTRSNGIQSLFCDHFAFQGSSFYNKSCEEVSLETTNDKNFPIKEATPYFGEGSISILTNLLKSTKKLTKLLPHIHQVLIKIYAKIPNFITF